MLSEKIKFVREPQEQDYGIIAVFEDLYGNLWDLLPTSQVNCRLIHFAKISRKTLYDQKHHKRSLFVLIIFRRV